MSEERYRADCLACPTHTAVLVFASTAYETLARRVIFRLQRIKATGIYGDDYQHRTLWDEYCHEVQEGPYEPLESAWEAAIDPILDSLIQKISPHEAVLLTIGAAWELDREDEIQSGGGVAPHLIQCSLRQTVAKLASARDMSRFDPHE